MRLRKAKRARPAVWSGVFVSALLLVSVYVFFDVLDVDGSQMTGWPAGDIMVVMTQQVDAERFFHPDFSASGPIDFVPSSRVRLSSAEIDNISTATTILRIRQSRLLPRVNLCQELACACSPSADPA